MNEVVVLKITLIFLETGVCFTGHSARRIFETVAGSVPPPVLGISTPVLMKMLQQAQGLLARVGTAGCLLKRGVEFLSAHSCLRNTRLSGTYLSL